MKKLLPIAILTAGIFTMSSCERTFTCTCVYPGVSSGGTTKTQIKAYKRSDAVTTCNKMHQGAQLNGGSCAL